MLGKPFQIGSPTKCSVQDGIQIETYNSKMTFYVAQAMSDLMKGKISMKSHTNSVRRIDRINVINTQFLLYLLWFSLYFRMCIIFIYK